MGARSAGGTEFGDAKQVVDDLPGKGGHRVSEGNRAPEDTQPLTKPVHEQRLARTVGAEQEEASQAELEDPGHE